MTVSTESIRPKLWKFIFLNLVRTLSLAGLILLFISSIVTMANDIKAVNAFTAADRKQDCAEGDCDYIAGSTVPNQAAGAFWAVLSRLLIIFQAVVLILSELGWPAKFFDGFFPILGRDFGLGPLGIFQCLLGSTVLSHHVDTFSLVSAFFLFSVGCLNMLLGLIWREHAKAIRSTIAWRRASKDVLPTTTADLPPTTAASNTFTGLANASDKEREALGAISASRSASTVTKGGKGFGRQGEKAAAAQGYYVREPEESVPPYAPKRTSSPA